MSVQKAKIKNKHRNISKKHILYFSTEFTW